MNSIIAKVQKELLKDEAFLIKSFANRFYMTKFSSSAGIVLITKNNAYFLIDFRYFEKAKSEVCGFDVIMLEKTFAQLNDILSGENVKTLYTECDEISLKEFYLYKKSITACTLSDDNKFGNLITNFRSIKTDGEISLIKKAQKITDDTFSYILNSVKAGKTEKEIALEMEFYLRKQGSEGVSFDFIVVSGKNSSLPHGTPTDKPIQKGDFVTMDFGAVVGGYRSDMTRTVAVGSVSDYQAEVYNTVLEAQNRAFETAKPDVLCKDVDYASRKFIDESGFKGCFGHGLGHSVGIEIHENPSFNTRDETLLKSGMVITVEPGIYIENKFGVRIEDMIVITENGFENITKSDKSLIVI